MSGPDRTAEQQQLMVEIETVARNIGAAEGSAKDYEVAQGRDLIEKAARLGLPAEAYAELQRAVDGRSGAASG